MLKISEFRNKLLGKAVELFLGAVALFFLVFALSWVFKSGLDVVHDRLHSLDDEYADHQRTFSMANDLTLDLAVPGRSGEPGEAAIVDRLSRLEDLAGTGGMVFDNSTSQDYAALQKARIELEEIVAGTGPAEHADELVARLIPTLRGFSAGTESAMRELRKARAQLIREDASRADYGTFVMLCVGFAAFTAVCLLTGRFFLQLSRDLGRLQQRAKRIAEGHYGEPLIFERKDEVGELAQAVDAMARALAERATEVENAHHHLFQSEKMVALGTFATGIAHEIANPIHSITMICEQLADSLAADSTGRDAAMDRKHLQMIAEQLDSMDSALRDLSNFASPVEVEMEPMSVNSALESAIQLLHFDTRFRGIRLTTNLSREVPLVYGAANQLTQVAINILINASDAIDGEDGTIAVTSAPSRDGALVTIEDNGCGMSKKTCEKALDVFFTTKPSGEGTGLGLAVCKAIIDRHRGTLTIDSEPGRGTRLEIRIPSAPRVAIP